MKIKTASMINLITILLAACVNIDPVQGAMNPTRIQVQVVEPTTEKVSPAAAQPAAPTAVQAVSSEKPAQDAWLIALLQEDNTLLRGLSATGQPLRELGAASGREHFAGSADPSHPWFSLYSPDDDSLNIINVLAESPAELLVTLKSKELPEEKRALLKTEFLRTDQPAQVWSPDGTRLAYLDVPSGEKTRLMLFDTATKTSTVLSQATEDVVAPVWSPDGMWVLYQTIDGFTAQGLPQVTSMHAVRSNGSEDNLLYEPTSLRETVLGWAGPEIFAVQTMMERGNLDLRLVSIKDASSLKMDVGLVKNASWDAKMQSAFYLLTSSETNNEQPSGVYTISATAPQAMVLPGKWEQLQYFTSSGVLAASMPGEVGMIHPNGTITSIKGVDSPITISPDGQFYVLNNTNGSVSIYGKEGASIGQLSEKPLQEAFFTPDSQKIYFTVSSQLFIASAPDWKPQPSTDATSLLGWVGF